MTEADFNGLNRLRTKRLLYKGDIVAFSGIDNKEKLIRINNPDTPKRKFWARFENVELATTTNSSK